MLHNSSILARECLLNLAPALRPHWDRLKASPLGYRLARGAFWSLAGALISRGLALISGILVARLLGKHGFGQLGMIQSTVGMFGILAGFGMGLTATKHVAELRGSDPGRAGRIIGLSSLVSWGTGALMTIALLATAPWLAKNVLVSAEMTGLLRAGALLLVLGGVNGAQTGALSGFEAFKRIAHVNLFSGLLSFPVTVVGALSFGVEGAVWANVITLGVNCLLNYFALRLEAHTSGVPLGYRGCWRDWSVLWSFSVPAVLGGALLGPVAWAANAMLVNQPDGYSQMGAYNAILRIKQVPEAALTMLLAPLLPVLSDSLSRFDRRHYLKTASFAFSLSLAVSAPFAMVQLAVPSLTLVPYGEAYGGHEGIVQWLMLDLAAVGVLTPLGTILTSLGKMWFLLFYTLCFTVVYGAVAFLLIPGYGALGLGAALTLGHLVVGCPFFYYVYRKEKALLKDLALGRFCGAVFAVALGTFAAGKLARPAVALAVAVAGILVLIAAHQRLFKPHEKEQVETR